MNRIYDKTMKWTDTILDRLNWTGDIKNREKKEKVARQIAEKVKDGEVIGIGSGSTSYLALLAIAERVKQEKLSIRGIPTSLEIAMTCSKLNIPLTSLMEYRPDWAFDGADEVDPAGSLIKGRGGAMFKEKLLILSAPKVYIIVDGSKMVERLGSRFPVPVEVFPGAVVYVEQKLREYGAVKVELRPAGGKDGPVITENGNFILDAWFDHIPENMEVKLKSITGIMETGLFIGYDIEVMVS